MKFSPSFLCAFTLAVLALHSYGQHAVSPQPVVPPVVPIDPVPTPKPSRITVALSLAGYEFDVVSISGKPTSIIIDPQSPIVVPLAKPATTAATTVYYTPGFWATFVLSNTSPFNRDFTFATQSDADQLVTFTVLDAGGNEVWSSQQFLVDPSPVHKQLKASSAWRKPVYVPLAALAAGDYTLTATLNGSPVYSASGAFTVKTLSGGPIVSGPIALPAKN